MNTEFLKGLGITDQATIDAIFAENGRDVNKAKGDLTKLTEQVAGLQEQLKERNEQLEKLKDANKDNESLQKKLTALQEENKASEEKYAAQLLEVEKTHAIENAVRDAKPRNLKAVQALLDMDKISYKDGKLEGLDSQLKALKEGEDSKFLFADETNPNPSGFKPADPANHGGNGGGNGQKSFTDAIAAALAKQ